MIKKLWFLSRRAFLYYREHGSIIQPNVKTEVVSRLQKKVDRYGREENLNSSIEFKGAQQLNLVVSREKIGYGKRKLAE